ncbi:MAG TPA: TGS domain-containing protein [Firmicutes bacterium]|nr:TGS domain-containing protein [Bacillota bacterium]
MPANLTPQYYAAEEKYKLAVSPEEKLDALKEMLATIPKHKGTEKLQADIKKKISLLKKESQKKKNKSGFNPFHVEKQGAGQVVMAGYPNVGKSTLLKTLTRANPKVAEYPFTTTIPLAGMMPYEDILIQLVDTPPITPELVPAGLMGTFKAADALLVIIDAASENCLEQLDETLKLLAEKKIIFLPEQEENQGGLPYLVVANKTGSPESLNNLAVIRELMPAVKIIPFTPSEASRDDLKKAIFQMLGIVRIYSKPPGHEPDMNRPFTIKEGGTVLDFAAAVHRDFPAKLKNALVWGSSKFDGQAVPKDYVLKDKDIVELQL